MGNFVNKWTTDDCVNSYGLDFCFTQCSSDGFLSVCVDNNERYFNPMWKWVEERANRLAWWDWLNKVTQCTNQYYTQVTQCWNGWWECRSDYLTSITQCISQYYTLFTQCDMGDQSANKVDQESFIKKNLTSVLMGGRDKPRADWKDVWTMFYLNIF
jgi:hypothetical protein